MYLYRFIYVHIYSSALYMVIFFILNVLVHIVWIIIYKEKVNVSHNKWIHFKDLLLVLICC